MSRCSRILVVDDEGQSREQLKSLLTGLGHEVLLAADGFRALSAVKQDVDLVLVDAGLPGLDGFELSRRIREVLECGSIPICMVMDPDGKASGLKALEAGANDIITRPIDEVELAVRTSALLKTKAAQDEIRRQRAEQDLAVERRCEQLHQEIQNLTEAQQRSHGSQWEMIEKLVVAAEYKDEGSAYHIRRMSHYSELIARKMGLPKHESQTILAASAMHDVGKSGIPDAILLKPAKLSEDEWAIMKRHTVIGARILCDSTTDVLQAGEVIAASHHEKWNGTGYPNALAGNDIPVWGRIAAIADVFDAITSKRPYKEATGIKEGVDIMKKGAVSHFDPNLLELFLSNLDEVTEIYTTYQDG